MDSKFVADEETAAPALAEVASPRAGASGGWHLNRDIVAALHDFELEWDVDLYLSVPICRISGRRRGSRRRSTTGSKEFT